jgi:sulfopyruvate decarboxylase subunit alpha
MKESNQYFDAVIDGLLDWELEMLVYVPSSHSAPVIRGLQARGIRAVMANREEEAVGIAGGLAMVGRRAAIVMQDNGFGNAITALATFAVEYHAPIPIFANSRGGPGEYNAMIHSVSEAAPQLLQAIGVRVERLGVSDDPGVWRQSVAATARLAQMQHRPIVTIFEALHPSLAVAR